MRRTTLVLMVILTVFLVRMERTQGSDTYDEEDPSKQRHSRQGNPSSSTTSTTESPSTTSTTTTTDSPPATPPTTEDPNDYCGTYLVAEGGIYDPAPCVNTTCSKTGDYCMKDFSDDSLYSCLWTAPFDSADNGFPTNVTVPGNCDENNVPPAYANLTSQPAYVCHMNPNVTETLTNTKCICTEWNNGTCPDEELKSCERNLLKKVADKMVEQTMEISEDVHPGCPCNYTLEKQIPMVIDALNERRNLYRVVTFLFEARKQHICNRRRLMTCQPDGTCGCAPGTKQRQHVRPNNIIYWSYYCYATQGDCDADPAEAIPQFEITKRKVWEHYGNPSEASHKDEHGCFYNYCTNPEDLKGRRKCGFAIGQ